MLIRLIVPLLMASAAHAATLPEAIHRWTGVTADVIGHGQQVSVTLPSSSPVPQFTALATASTRAGDPGWQLGAITLPQPLRLRGGDTMRLQSQAATAWLGERTVMAAGRYGGIAIARDGHSTYIDHASLALNSTGGPATLALDFDGARLDRPAPLLPRQGSVRGHTTPAGAEALSALFAGRAGGSAPLTIDRAVLLIGPAEMTAQGSVTVLSPHDRTGELTVTARQFNELLRSLPMDQSTAAIYPALMILRQLGQKEGDRVSWTVTFSGRHVLVNGIDIAPLLGL